MDNNKNNNLTITNTYIEATCLNSGNDYFRSFLLVIFKNKKLISTFFTMTFLMTLFFTYLSPKIYQSNARLLIKVGRENVSMDPSVVGPTMSISQNREYEVNSEVATITSQLLAERVADKIGPENLVKKTALLGFMSTPSVEDIKGSAAAKIMDSLTVEVEKKSSIINLSFQGESPLLTQRSLDTLVSSYLDRHIEVHKAQASPQFFEERLNELQMDLFAKEERLKLFKEKNSIASLEEQKKQYLEQIMIFRKETDDLSSQISASHARIESLEMSLRERSPVAEVSRVTGRTNYAADAIKERLMDLRLKEADLSSRYPDNDRALIDVREQINLAEKALAKEVDTHTEVTIGLDANYQSMRLSLENERAHYDALLARKMTLEEKLKKRQVNLNELVSHETQFARLQRDVELAGDEYRNYRDNHQRARISAELDMDKVSNVSIVQPATLPLKPIRPKMLLNIVLGIFLGLFGGIGLALFIEYFDGTLKTPEDVNRRLGLAVLASVSSEEFDSCI